MIRQAILVAASLIAGVAALLLTISWIRPIRTPDSISSPMLRIERGNLCLDPPLHPSGMSMAIKDASSNGVFWSADANADGVFDENDLQEESVPRWVPERNIFAIGSFVLAWSNCPVHPEWWNRLRLSIPLWLPVIVFATYPIIAFIRGPWRRYRHKKHGLCVKCGYDLTGNQSGVCSECGQSTKPPC